MSQDDKRTGWSSSGVLWLALLGVGAFFLHDVPWQGARPTAGEAKSYAYVAQQDVDARLWQDPIGAVARALEEARKRAPAPSAAPPSAGASPSADAHRPDRVALSVGKRLCAGDDVLLLGASFPGGGYPEYVEFRRRARYAVLAALHETGLVPEDEEHLGYFVPDDTGATKALPDFIAYEWMVAEASAARPAGAASAAAGAAAPADVLVLWLDEDRVGADMPDRIRRIAALLDAPACTAPTSSRGRLRVAVLGPSTTGPLQQMMASAAASSSPAAVPAAAPAASAGAAARAARVPTVFYAYGATASDARLLAGRGSSRATVHEALLDADIALFRTIQSDEALATELVRELALRNVRPDRAMCPKADADADERKRLKESAAHVVFIAERDSFYGRSLPKTVAGEFKHYGDCEGAAAVDAGPLKTLHAYSYLRGLDGQLPAATSADAGAARKDDAPADAKGGGGSSGNDPRRIERPEGQSQFDYLRRLTEQIGELEERLRSDRRGSIRAIGVLGSDVYDKLLILQALRSQFPNAIVFTTDMDARLQHPQQLDWTHNAVVVSSFGLALDERLQRDIPPFRDGYQTALFLSTMVAVNQARHAAARDGDGCDRPTLANEQGCLGLTQGDIDRWLKAPRVFEIGRKGVFDFSTAAARSPGSADCSPAQLASCTDGVQPGPSPMYPDPAQRWIRLAFGLLAGTLLLVGLFDGAWVKLGVALAAFAARPSAIGWRRGLASAAAPAGVLLALAMVVWGGDLWDVLATSLTTGGEPITVLLGVSAWPTEALRLLALVLSIVFVVRGWQAIDRNLDDISTNLMWQPERRALMRQLHDENARWSKAQRFVRMFSFRLVERGGGDVNPATGLLPSAERFWRKYMYQGRRTARVLRIVAVTVLYLLTARFVIAAFGEPVAPWRGPLLVLVDPVLTMGSVFAMLLLIFFVVDATVFTYQLVTALRRRIPPRPAAEPQVVAAAGDDVRWPQRTLEIFAQRLHLEPRFLDDWISMHFVARRTEAVGRLIYYPFIVISLMVVARSQVFDNWNTSVGLAAVISGSVLIVIGCAIALRWSAERLRRSALWRLGNAKIQLNGEDDAGRRKVAQLDVLIAQIRAFDSGAFAPYSQQPLVRALLLPLTSFGGTVLVDYLSIANF